MTNLSPHLASGKGTKWSFFELFAGTPYIEQQSFPLVKQDWLYEHPARDVEYLFVLARNEGTGLTTISYDSSEGSKKEKMQIAAGSGAVVRIEKGRVSAALLKGINDFKENYVSPFCQVNGSEISADTPCDLLVIRKGDSYEVKVANAVRGKVTVRLPNREETKMSIL